MKINIVCVGKIKERFYTEACKEYIKRLQKFCNVTIIETAENTVYKIPNEAQTEELLKAEAEDYKKYLKGHIIVLDIDGKAMDSENLSSYIKNKKTEGISEITFLIGSSYGISKNTREKADLRLSFSQMTFPHQLFRVMLLEQIYRAFMIENNRTYHK